MATANQTFQTILNTAEKLIQEKGCRQTTLQDIIRETGLSKGAIYHYVSSKDELFGLILKARMELMNARFTDVVNRPQAPGLEDPLQLIAEGMQRTSNHQDVTNLIFVYLLSQMDNPKVAEIVQHVYDYTLQTCSQWIEIGKMHGAIPSEVESRATAEMLVMLMYGLRVQNTIAQQPSRFTTQDLAAFMRKTLS
ncbi:TetR/AcrR family transcriptional regulator [Cohnella lubricantis]|uniref:TetR/AcrR family transcriptional regulator n=1 Tax=Cohnella lubricantis TaxID=2163172 RepID=A0A841T994_9BACL|nr:TetR/AcrR family transcriptional regulator [Cohnella lubricantis]MBB6677874.1 TetR/AcrR family transcriptional regulator [Cohnella lubricantis]MBP2119056.1 AcrR family transcriptional regulator [Cohnella lubricantis]